MTEPETFTVWLASATAPVAHRQRDCSWLSRRPAHQGPPQSVQARPGALAGFVEVPNLRHPRKPRRHVKLCSQCAGAPPSQVRVTWLAEAQELAGSKGNPFDVDAEVGMRIKNKLEGALNVINRFMATTAGEPCYTPDQCSRPADARNGWLCPVCRRGEIVKEITEP